MKKRTIAAKAKKPSTYAAISAILGALVPVFPQYAVALTAAAVIAGSVGALIPGAPPSEAP